MDRARHVARTCAPMALKYPMTQVSVTRTGPRAMCREMMGPVGVVREITAATAAAPIAMHTGINGMLNASLPHGKLSQRETPSGAEAPPPRTRSAAGFLAGFVLVSCPIGLRRRYQVRAPPASTPAPTQRERTSIAER